VARRQSSRALFPAPAGLFPHAEPLALPAVFLREVIRLRSCLRARAVWGLHRLAAVASEGRCRIGDVEGRLLHSRPSVSQCRQVERRKGQEPADPARRSFCEGRRQHLGFGESCRGARPLLISKTVYSLPTSRPGAALPFDQPGPERGRIQKQRQAGPTPPLKRTAEAF
jgi:hypothetical protein